MSLTIREKMIFLFVLEHEIVISPPVICLFEVISVSVYIRTV